MSSISGADVVAAARSCMNIPFAHQGRHPATGLDCIGLLLWSYRGAGWAPRHEEATQANYQRIARDDTLSRVLQGEAEQVEEGQPGDVLVFQWAGRHLPQHVGLVTEAAPEPAAMMMIHCCAMEAYGSRVTEHVLGTEWATRLIGIHRLQGVGP